MAGNQNPLVPPMDPAALAKLGFQNPFGPPPPPSPSLGFQTWAADPQNGQKVAVAMTPPNAPLQPGAGKTPAQSPAQPQLDTSALDSYKSPWAPPDMSAFKAQPPQVSVAPAPTMQQDQAANPNKYAKPIVRGTGTRILNSVVAGLQGAAGGLHGDPGAGVQYALQTRQHDEGIPQQNQQTYNATVMDPYQRELEAGLKQRMGVAQLEDTQSQTAERKAQADKASAQGQAYQPVTLTPEQATAIGHPELAGEELNSKTYAAMLTGKQKTDSAETIAGGKNQTQKDIADQRNARLTSLAAEANKTKLLVQGMKDNTSRANTSARIDAGGGKGGKVPADVTKRAALAANTIENADAVQGLITKRPEIVGAVGGRYTNVQQMVGSDDSDIQELGVRMHNIALASNGAHGLRSAEAVAQTEKELFNHFKTGPQGIAGGLKGLTSSVQTFLDDEQNFQKSGSRTGGGNPLQRPALTFKQTASGPGGTVGSNDGGVTWFDTKTGKKVE